MDPDPLADREGDRVEDGGEVATDLALDLDGGDHQLEVLGVDAPHQVVQCRLHREAQLHLADDALELLADRRSRLAGHELDALEERGPCAERVGQQGDRVGKLVSERLDALALAALQVEARERRARAATAPTSATGFWKPGNTKPST